MYALAKVISHFEAFIHQALMQVQCFIPQKNDLIEQIFGLIKFHVILLVFCSVASYTSQNAFQSILEIASYEI